MAARKSTAGAQGPQETKLDTDVATPSTVAPGDAPHDTTDPDERATSVVPDKAAAAQAGHGTVNAVVPLPAREKVAAPKRDARVEEYEQVAPDGKVVKVKHNIDTGETSIA